MSGNCVVHRENGRIINSNINIEKPGGIFRGIPIFRLLARFRGKRDGKLRK